MLQSGVGPLCTAPARRIHFVRCISSVRIQGVVSGSGEEWSNERNGGPDDDKGIFYDYPVHERNGID